MVFKKLFNKLLVSYANKNIYIMYRHTQYCKWGRLNNSIFTIVKDFNFKTSKLIDILMKIILISQLFIVALAKMLSGTRYLLVQVGGKTNDKPNSVCIKSNGKIILMNR